MYYGWYSSKHEQLCGGTIYELNGKKTTVTFVSRSYDKGKEYVKTRLDYFDDYEYIGIVGQWTGIMTRE